MTKTKTIICLFLIICIVAGLCACGNKPTNNHTDAVADSDTTYTDNKENAQIEGSKLTEENVVGTGWQCTYHTDDGNKIYTRFTLATDGTYNQIIAINGLFDHSEKGTYEVKNGKLYLNSDANTSTVYEYKNGNLFNDKNEFTAYVE